MALIELMEIHRVYQIGKVDVHALRGMTISIDSGEFVSIMGPSGSGKSTLLNVIGCLDRPTKGAFNLSGQDVTRLGEGELAGIRNHFFGFVFQSFHLLPNFTARENVELPLVYRGLPYSERLRRTRDSLEAVGLGDRANHRPVELSGGEQQRVAIARALVAEPAVILADEPTGNLDTRTSRELMSIFQNLNRDKGITIIQVTHDPLIAQYGWRVLHMRDGLLEKEEAATVSPWEETGRQVSSEEQGERL
jgi:putative ABC transport system ATP-binding protein